MASLAKRKSLKVAWKGFGGEGLAADFSSVALSDGLNTYLC